MKFEQNGVSCEFVTNGYSGQAVVLLHGWGGDMRSMSDLYAYLTRCGICAVNMSIPYEVPDSWGIYDYALYIQSLLRYADIGTDALLCGHSFGGRIAMILAARGECKKLLLVDSAGLKPRYSIKKQWKIYRYKSCVSRGKDVSAFGSDDYKALSAPQRKVFNRIVNTHLNNLLPLIQIPTRIVWGKRDKDTPLYMAKQLKRGIKGSTLTVLEGGHFSYIDSSDEFKSILLTFALR